ncbi:anchored repeat ABC transporter, substrate-binding protein [Corynebacterium singulare]|uniref:Anchored repeat ABC transporter, substrate-binding protein n=1 Tax=Corynebacterium singulare TaxID=161899 RepID=A0A0B6F2V5_9CORY|nr:anchored repeat ABC transporter, substrate-binding protein [Corynebacterium singulare]AJI78785.1 anchored repeat ABC transporter, substrate-binding protein [Corynebacterium singulare]
MPSSAFRAVHCAALLIVVATSAALTTCTSTAAGEDGNDASLKVVATTPILGDVAKHVAGPNAQVTTLIPAGKDPHTFEPSLRTVRDIANADVLLANGLLLEPQNLMKSLRESSDVPVTEVADEASTRGATLVPLVENVALDAIWLGLRVRNAPSGTNSVDMRLQSAEGPGDVAAYVVSTFGTPEPLFNTADGIDDREDSTTLPANAHTHVSWAFSKPGIYRLTFTATNAGPQEVTVAVGVNPPEGMRSLSEGHVDITADIANGTLDLEDQGERFDPTTTALSIPNSTLQEIPPSPAYRFLGRPGDETYLLPQAVLGKHLHGEVDPHLWHNAKNVITYAEVIADQLALADPSHGADYRGRAHDYALQVREADSFVRDLIEDIPEDKRHLVTPHHGYAYLEQGYGIDIAGFVTPNPAIEPSPRDVIALRRTLENLRLPAVFIEPTQEASADVIRETAHSLGIAVCPIYGDTLDESVPSYLDLMRFNAESLHRCLAEN